MNATPPLVTIDPETMGGKPCFAGTRVPIQIFFDWLAFGHTVDYFADQIRSVSIDQLRAVLARSAELIKAEASPVEAEASPLAEAALT